MLVELCRATARRRGHAPWFMLAGDEGQTVRPSGFEWARLNDLLAARLTQPQEFGLVLQSRLRSRCLKVSPVVALHGSGLVPTSPSRPVDGQGRTATGQPQQPA